MVLLVCSSSIAGIGHVRGEVFGTNLVVSPNSAAEPDVAIGNGGNLYIVWADMYGGPNEDLVGVYCAKSTDNGTSFGSAVLVGDSGKSVDDAAVATYGENNVYVVWLGEDGMIYYARSINGGDSFEAKVQVSDADGCDGDPDIAVDSNGVIYVVWDGGDYIYIDKSTDGTAFGTDVIVDNDDSPMTSCPSIAIGADNSIHVVGNNEHVYYAKSTDGGATFTSHVQVDDSDYEAYDPSIGVGADGKIFVAWEDLRNLTYYGHIYAAVSSDGGATFGAGVRVDDDTTAMEKRHPSLAVHPCGKVFVAWSDGRTDPPDIYFANSTDSGVSFNTNIKVNDQPAAADCSDKYPSLAVGDDTEVYITWRDERNGTNVSFSQADDATWPNAVTDLAISNLTDNSISLTWTAPGDNFALGTATTYDIRYSTSEIDDTNWDSATQVTTPPTPQAGGAVETFTVSGLNNDTTYYFALKTADEVPNWSPLSNVVTTLRNQAPNAPTLTAPANDTWITTGLPTFTWIFSDPDTGDAQGGYLWQGDNNSNFSSPEYENETTSNISSYTPTTAISDGIWHWRVKTKDDKGEWGDYSEYRVIKIDTMAPTGSIVINAGNAKTNSTTVALTLSATDATSGVSQMCFSNNGTSYTAWEAYATSKTWNLVTDDGTKIVYVKYKDNAGNVEEYNVTITLDTTTTTKITENTTGAVVTAQHTGTGTVIATSVSSPGSAPSGKETIGKFVNITAPTTLPINWVNITIPYTANDLPSGVDESSLKMYYWTGTEWVVCSNTGVDTVNKVIWANRTTNVTEPTVFAPMATATPSNWGLYGGIAVGAIIIIVVAAIVVTKKKKGKGEIPESDEAISMEERDEPE